MRRYAALILVLLLIAGFAAAQSSETPTPTPLILGPVNQVTATPTPIPPDDPRPAICSAPYQADFEPYIVRPGDQLVDLLPANSSLSITQIAALNCLDNPAALPVGAVIWLPAGLQFEAVITHDSDPAVDEAEIISLRASDERVQNFAGVTFSWQVRGTEIYFYPCNPDPEIDCLRPTDAQPRPLDYQTPIITFRYAGTVRYRLEVVDGEAVATQDITLEVVCSQTALAQYSGSQPCPDESPRSITGVWQTFEHGLMLWFSDTRQIYALLPDGVVLIFPDLFQSGDPEEPLVTATPTDGKLIPLRGFGRVWSELGGEASALGWATSRESGVDIFRQPAGRVSYTTYIQPQGGAVYAITLLPEAATGVWSALPDTLTR